MVDYKNEEDLLKWANGAVYEADWASSEWRSESWRDCEIYDGGEAGWSQKDWAEAIDAGIDPLTVNRAFPAINKLLGSQVVNRFEILARGRTPKDSEIASVMTEGIKFVSDQYGGEFIISQAYADQLIPGFGCMAPCFNPDPRQERVAWKYRDWKEIKWDPFSSPWWSLERTRYVYWQPWTDLDDFKAVFDGKSKEIDAAYDELCGTVRERGYSTLLDEAQQKEDRIRTLASSSWIDAERKRIRPVEMWYPVNERCMFSLFADGRCFEIRDNMDHNEAFELIRNGNQILRAIVKKMRVLTFFGEHLILQNEPSPYHHDQFPLVPFVGYLDRWGMPYGVPRQIRGESEEVNKRRSMALAMLKKRRIQIEEDAVSPAGNKEALDEIYREANKLDGMIVLKTGGLNKVKIEELAQLSQFQINLMQQSEYEIRDITGSDSPQFAQEQAQSGVAKQQDAYKSQMTTASLMDNLRRSLSILGYQTGVNIQGAWKYEKVLRVVDRLTGAERFVRVNQPLEGGVKNDITQSKFDYVISETPVTDTVRDKNLEILYQAIAKSPPQAIPVLLIAAFEMSDLPNKETLLEKLKPLMGVDPGESSEDPEETKRKVMETLKAQQQEAEMNNQLNMELIKVKLQEAQLKNAKLEAEIQKIKLETQIAADDHDLAVDRQVVQGMEDGLKMKTMMEQGVTLEQGNGQKQQKPNTLN